MVTSDTWRVLSSSLALRSFILQHTRVDTVGLLPHGVFEDATVKPLIILLESEPDAELRSRNLINVVDFESKTSGVKVPQLSWEKDRSHLFAVGTQIGKVGHFSESFNAKVIPLGQIITVDFGLKTGDDTIFINRTGSHPDDKKVFPSKCISKYLHVWDGEYVRYEPALMRKHRPTARPGEPERFEREKIVLSRMAEGLAASLDREYYYIKDAFLLALPEAGYSLEYLLALLNSRFLNLWYKVTFTTVDTHRNEVTRIPIRDIAFTTPQFERNRFLNKGKTLYEKCLAKQNQSCVLEFVEHALQQAPEQADVVHDLLAFLAEQMIEMNTAKQAEVKGFLGWLEREIGAKVDDLKNKTKLKNYHDSTFEVLLEVLKENHRSLSVDPSERKFQDRLAKEYTDSLAKLGPLKARIETTDRLIDQIVYRLYGLTEEEISIVGNG